MRWLKFEVNKPEYFSNIDELKSIATFSEGSSNKSLLRTLSS